MSQFENLSWVALGLDLLVKMTLLLLVAIVVDRMMSRQTAAARTGYGWRLLLACYSCHLPSGSRPVFEWTFGRPNGIQPRRLRTFRLLR